jgi:hypothetical protein
MSKRFIADFVAKFWLTKYKKQMSKENYTQYVKDFKASTIVYKATWKSKNDPVENLPHGIKVINIEEARING